MPRTGRPRILETTTVCPDCGGKKYRYAQFCSKCKANGSRNAMFGRTHDEETRQRIRDSHPPSMLGRLGELHPTFKDGIASYKRFRQEQCERCGSSRYLLVHYRDRDRHNNSTDNLETLCKRCHQVEHDVGRFLPHAAMAERRIAPYRSRLL